MTTKNGKLKTMEPATGSKTGQDLRNCNNAGENIL
jgi:hypothetical protein